MLKRLSAEFTGTAIMVGFGCLSIKMGMSSVVVSAVFGISVFLAIFLFRDISGAHINPAVSIAFYRSGHLESKALIPYISVQFLGGLLAAIIIGDHGMTSFSVDLSIGIFIEIMITFILMSSIYLVILKTDKTIFVSLWVGFVVALLALFSGKYTGASMNPARTFGPNLISGQFSSLPIFLLSTTIGALIASELYNLLKKNRGNWSENEGFN